MCLCITRKHVLATRYLQQLHRGHADHANTPSADRAHTEPRAHQLTRTGMHRASGRNAHIDAVDACSRVSPSGLTDGQVDVPNQANSAQGVSVKPKKKQEDSQRPPKPCRVCELGFVPIVGKVAVRG
eukprot:3048155-Prymnesium_polylepis.2